jgi:hypothetical protein
MSSTNLPSAKDVRLALRDAKRDWAGFIEGEAPSLSEEQVKWLSLRLGSESDEATCRVLNVSPVTVMAWRADPGFAAVEQTAMGNKREGFRLLTTHLLPKAVRRIEDLLDSASLRDVAKGVTLLLRVQGMLVDGQKLIDKDDLQMLMERLRAPSSITALPGPVVDGEFVERSDI